MGKKIQQFPQSFVEVSSESFITNVLHHLFAILIKMAVTRKTLKRVYYASKLKEYLPLVQSNQNTCYQLLVLEFEHNDKQDNCNKQLAFTYTRDGFWAMYRYNVK